MVTATRKRNEVYKITWVICQTGERQILILLIFLILFIRDLRRVISPPARADKKEATIQPSSNLPIFHPSFLTPLLFDDNHPPQCGTGNQHQVHDIDHTIPVDICLVLSRLPKVRAHKHQILDVHHPIRIHQGDLG